MLSGKVQLDDLFMHSNQPCTSNFCISNIVAIYTVPTTFKQFIIIGKLLLRFYYYSLFELKKDIILLKLIHLV
jgi:hypothetical protein